jgi:hypothetical protein
MTKRDDAKATTESKIEEFAEDIGQMLGNAKAKAESWLGQRHTVVKHLSEIRDTAAKLLADLGHEAAATVRVGRKPGRPAGTAVGIGTVEPDKRGPGRPKRSGKKKRTMSADARARISAAQKKRWAAKKAGEKEK